MHQNKADSGYNYVGCHTDDLVIVTENDWEIIDSLMKIYEVNYLGPPLYHLGCNYSKVVDEGGELVHWQLYTCKGSTHEG